MLTVFLLLPVVGALLIAFLPKEREHEAKYLALAASGLAFAIAIAVFIRFDPDQPGYQMVDRFVWIRAADAGFSVQYVLGVDGLSTPMVLLTGLLSVASVLVSFN